MQTTSHTKVHPPQWRKRRKPEVVVIEPERQRRWEPEPLDFSDPVIRARYAQPRERPYFKRYGGSRIVTNGGAIAAHAAKAPIPGDNRRQKVRVHKHKVRELAMNGKYHYVGQRIFVEVWRAGQGMLEGKVNSIVVTYHDDRIISAIVFVKLGHRRREQLFYSQSSRFNPEVGLPSQKFVTAENLKHRLAAA